MSSLRPFISAQKTGALISAMLLTCAYNPAHSGWRSVDGTGAKQEGLGV